MAGSLAQISEKAESETECEFEFDTGSIAFLLPLIYSANLLSASDLPGAEYNSSYTELNGDIFILNRNLRI
jgi:hypothetical protein